MLYAPAMIARWFEHNSNARPADRASAAMLPAKSLMIQLLFSPKKYFILKKRYLYNCTCCIPADTRVD